MRRRAAALTAAITVVAVDLACGARTPLANRRPGEACGTPGATRPCTSICGTGLERCVEGAWDACDAPAPRPPPASMTIQGTVRDVLDTHPDFEDAIGDDHAIVQAVLGPDQTPTYAGQPVTSTTHGAAAFASWFHDVPGVNLSAPLTITLARDGGTYVYASSEFFPIDGKLLGNQGRAHDFHFTLELHSVFEYRGGERLTFSGDDDLFLFVDRRIAIDLGGVHATESATIALDELGLERGQVYPFDLFFAERHTDGSTFRIETTIASFDPCE